MMSIQYVYPESLYQQDFYEDDWGIQCVIEAFQENPFGFEYLCAELLEQVYHYDIMITSCVKDGGYDLVCWSADTKRMLVECKCYDIQNKVGRPLLQKLVGANATAKADSLCFITTSDYTYDAVEYAKEVGMQLYNGETIEHWMRCYFRK